MSEFNKLCQIFERMDPETYSAFLIEKSARILPALALVEGDSINGALDFAYFIIGAMAADGHLSLEEYLLCEPLLKTFLGDGVNYEDTKKFVKGFKPESKELKKSVSDLVYLFGLLSEDLKDDIIIVCMLICAVDGKISLKERLWIKQLIKE